MRIVLLAFAILSLLCRTQGVERAGIEVATPKGWRVAVGTCTGDAIYSFNTEGGHPSVSLVVSARKYRNRDAEYITSGEWMDFYQFEDVLSQLGRMCEDELTWMAVRPLKLERFRKAVLGSCEFKSGDSLARRGRFLTVETPHEQGVLLVYCNFALGYEQLANEAFEISAASILRDYAHLKDARADWPNQVPEPTSGSVTPRADARVAPPPPVAHR